MSEKAMKGRRRHIPTRTCVACRQTDAKRDLVRVVRTPAGTVQVDLTGKKAGRGAYLCRQRVCWEQALRRGSLSHALKTTLSADDLALLQQFAATLPVQAVEAGSDTAQVGSE